MPVYDVPQSGRMAHPEKNLRSVSPGDFYTLLDGTEADEGLASVAIVRGPSLGMAASYSTFKAVGLQAGETVDVEMSNSNEDADYVSIGQMTSELDSPPGFPYLTDSGTPTFYRVRKSGGTPVVTLQR
jgi:hypothetical protein